MRPLRGVRVHCMYEQQNSGSKGFWILFMIFTELRHHVMITTSGYRFTKGLAQNLNLRTHLKLEYNIKSLNNIQKKYIFQAWWFLLYWTMSFNFLTCSMVLKLLRKEMLRNFTFCVSALVKRFPGQCATSYGDTGWTTK